jgi:hypothetical protein
VEPAGRRPADALALADMRRQLTYLTNNKQQTTRHQHTTKISTMPRNAAFKELYCIMYGLEIAHRDPQSKAIVAVECQFCKCFGRDNTVPTREETSTRTNRSREDVPPTISS